MSLFWLLPKCAVVRLGPHFVTPWNCLLQEVHLVPIKVHFFYKGSSAHLETKTYPPPRGVESVCGPTLGAFCPTMPATGWSSKYSWPGRMYHPGPFRKYASGLFSHDLATSHFSFFTPLADESSPYIRKHDILENIPRFCPQIWSQILGSQHHLGEHFSRRPFQK